MIPRQPRPVPPPSLRKPKLPEPAKPGHTAIYRFTCGCEGTDSRCPMHKDGSRAGLVRPQAPQPPKPKKPRKPYQPDPAAYWRFPDGTRFEGMHYHNGFWICTLCVPIGDEPLRVFPLKATGYEKLGRLAKSTWLDWLKQQEASRGDDTTRDSN